MARNNNPHRVDIAIYSILPPPFGGVSVHVLRLKTLIAQSGMTCRVYEQSGKSEPENGIYPAGKDALSLLTFLLSVRESIVHFHTSSLPLLMVAIPLLRLRKKQVMITLHGEKLMREHQGSSSLKSMLLSILLKRVTHIISVSQRLSDWLTSAGINQGNITLAPAFLPPTPEEMDERNLPKQALDLLNRRFPIIGSQGWFGSYVEGIHVYSFDMIAQAIDRLRRDYPNVGLYTAVSGIYDEEHRREIYQRRESLGLEDHWVILEEPFQAASLYARTTVFVRPTVTDGDSVSIRECLSFGVPVVASNSVTRPPQCLLFESRNLDEFVRQIQLALSSGAVCTNREPEERGGGLEIVRVYRNLLGRQTEG